jgi:hypothetical protein
VYFGDAKHQATNTPRRFNRALARFVTVTVFVVARSATVFVAARQFACGEAVRLTDEQSEELSQRERRKRPSATIPPINFADVAAFA